MTEFNWGKLMAEADQGVQPVPAGEYEVQVGTVVVKPTSTGKTMIQCRYNVVSGPHTGRPVFNNFTISPENQQSMGFFFRHMKAHGLDDGFFRQNPSAEQVAENLVGKLVHVKIGMKPYQGEDRNSLDGFSPSQLPGGATTVPAAPAPLGAPPTAPAAPLAPPVAPPMAPSAPPVAPLAPPVAPLPVAPPVAPPAPPEPAARQFDPASGMELVNNAWAWPAEASAGYVWNQAANTWVAPAPVAPVAPAPLAPPMPPAPPAPSF